MSYVSPQEGLGEESSQMRWARPWGDKPEEQKEVSVVEVSVGGEQFKMRLEKELGAKTHKAAGHQLNSIQAEKIEKVPKLLRTVYFKN